MILSVWLLLETVIKPWWIVATIQWTLHEHLCLKSDQGQMGILRQWVRLLEAPLGVTLLKCIVDAKKSKLEKPDRTRATLSSIALMCSPSISKATKVIPCPTKDKSIASSKKSSATPKYCSEMRAVNQQLKNTANSSKARSEIPITAHRPPL